MKTLVVVLALLAVVLLLLVADPLDFFGDASRAPDAEGEEAALREGDGARLTGRADAVRNREPLWLEGAPVGRIVLDQGKAALGGMVLGEGEPLSGAAVRVALPPRSERYVVLTDREGRYAVEGLPPGSVDLHVTAAAHQGATLTTPALVEGETLDVGEVDLRRRHEPRNALVVRVTDEAGRPVPGARILATSMLWGVHLAVGPQIAGVRDVREGRARTDDGGVARLEGLPPETYDVVVMATGFETAAQASVVVSHDRTTTLVFRLLPGVEIAGVVVDPDGRPLEGAYVSGLHQPSFANAETVRSAADGSFHLGGLRRGSYMVFAFHEGHGEVMANPVPSPSGGNRLTLSGSGTLELVARRPNGDPVTAFGARPYRAEPFGYTYSVVYPSSDVEGRLRIPLGPGTYQVSVQTPEGDMVAAPATTIAVGETSTVEVVVPATRSVSGVVVGPDGVHVAGAEVFVRHGGFPSGPVREHYARTDDEGVFEVLGLPATDTKLRVKHPEFAEASVDVTPQPAGEGAEITIRLERGARVHGVVARADGTPVAAEQVNLFPGFNFFEARSTRTDAAGAYAFEAVAEGTYTVSTGPLEANSRGVSRSNVAVGAGGAVQVDFQVGAAGADGVLEGVVLMAGQPVADATVTLTDERGFDRMVTVSTDERGAFRGEGLAYGRVTAQVQTPAGFTIMRSTTITDGEAAASLRIEFGAGGLRGRVRNETGAPVSGAWVQVELVGGDPTVPWGRVKAQTTTGQDGSFSAGGLEAGDYQVRVSGTSHAGLLSDPIAVPEGAVVDVGTYTVGAGRSIEGRVVDDEGRPVEDATISLEDAQGRPVFLFSMTTTGGDGRYQVGGLEPGRYTIGFEALGYAPAESEVVVDADGASVDAVLSRGGALELQVVDAAGEGLSGVRITLFDANGVPVVRTLSLVNLSTGGFGMTDGQGRAVIPDLAPGRYTVRAVRAGYAAPDEDPGVTIAPGAVAAVALTLRQM